MATYKKGILGGFLGKVGTVIGSFWKGRAVMRSIASSVHNPNTPAQVAQRARFGALASMLSACYPLVRHGFHRMAANLAVTESNVAQSTNLGNGSVTFDPISQSVSISYQDVLLSEGSLINVANGAAVQGTGHSIDLSWDDNTGISPEALATDVLMICLYNSDLHLSVCDVDTYHRSDTSATISYPATWVGDHIEVYVASRSDDSTLTSPSQHLASVTAA